MSYHSKTFRLFISSTFSDFQIEREALQTKVFPQIRAYCSTKCYTFQPIDLRWGVNNEAQLDQKALEMCIQEVQACKKHDYPNFLIMLGDRYGWIPLPNIIEKDEFEQILQHMNIEDKECLLSWYYKDANQIPISYILKKRTDNYTDHEKWLEIESKLRNILQTTVSSLDENIKKKYFTSATESEAIEGIISYSEKSGFQQKLIQLVPNIEQVDYQRIFGFFRNIDKNTIIEDKFVSIDYDKAQVFKEQVQEKLINENILNVSTTQISKDKLDEKYLDKFIVSVTNFLKQQVDNQISKDNEQNYSDLELEKLQQQFFKDQKLENFLGQENILDEIQKYINDDNDKPLIICGQSGIGKSSIIAKAIEETLIKTSKKIVYQFIGATPNSNTTKDLLTYILEELNISLESKEKLSPLTEQNEFINISDKVYNEIMNLSDDVVIFIDAVDQLTNDEQFLWLPNKLPLNIKVVISALKDRNYKDSSKYFYTLENKVSNYLEIKPFNKPTELLELLLSQQKRTLQLHQKEYFVQQYNKVQTPLYVHIAADQIQYWKSSDIVDTDVMLSSSQKEIVKSFIENLTTAHHHDKQLVQKVFGYVLASKDGLSEYEILELLNTDKELIRKLAPDTWHQNTTQELPLVIWIRLYNHIKPFLIKKNLDGQELLYFFHREFIDVVSNYPNQKDEHKSIIIATQKLIERNQTNEFNNNRWGKLYILLLIEYYLIDKNEHKVFSYYDKILSFIKTAEILKYLNYMTQKRDENILDKNSIIEKHLIKLSIYISQKYKEFSDEFKIIYIDNSHNLARIFIQEQDYTAALEIEKKNLKNIQSLPNFLEIINTQPIEVVKDNAKNIGIELKWLYLYFKINNMLGLAYMRNKDKECMLINKEIYLMFKDFHDKNPNNSIIKFFYYDHINYYATTLQQNGVFFEAIDLLKESLNILEKNYNSDDKHFWLYDTYAKTLYFLSGMAYSIKDKNWHEYFSKAYTVYTKLLKYNFLEYSETIIELNNYYINNYNANNLFLKSELYYRNTIMLLNRQGKKDVEEKIKIISNDLFAKVLDLKQKQKQLELFFVNKRLIEYVFNFEKKYWAKFYVGKLIALGGLLSKSKIDDQLSIAEKLQEEGVYICEQFMDEEDEWYDLYTKNLNNLANTYLFLNKKDESFVINNKNLDVSTKLFQINPQKWFRAYYYSLDNMANTYSYNGDDKKEKEFKNKIKELESNPQFQTVQDVIENKLTDKKIEYFNYFHKTLLLLGVYFFIKYIFLE